MFLLVVLSRDTHNNRTATAFSGDEGYSEEFSVITKKFNVCVHFLHLCENSFHKRCTFALDSSCTHNSVILIGLLEGSQTATLFRLTSFFEGYTDEIRKTLTFYLVPFAVNNGTHILALLLVNKTGNCTSAYSGRFFHLKTGVNRMSVLCKINRSLSSRYCDNSVKSVDKNVFLTIKIHVDACVILLRLKVFHNSNFSC